MPWVRPINTVSMSVVSTVSHDSLHNHKGVSLSVLLGMGFTFSMMQEGPQPPTASFLFAQSFAANLPAESPLNKGHFSAANGTF